VCHILATHNSTWCSDIQVVLTLLPTIHNSNPHWSHDPNRARTYYSPPHLSNHVHWSFAEFMNNQQAPERVSHSRFFIFTMARLTDIRNMMKKIVKNQLRCSVLENLLFLWNTHCEQWL
jgi:hypothetical protein